MSALQQLDSLIAELELQTGGDDKKTNKNEKNKVPKSAAVPAVTVAASTEDALGKYSHYKSYKPISTSNRPSAPHTPDMIYYSTHLHI